MPTVAELRKSGFKVRINHYRCFKEEGPDECFAKHEIEDPSVWKDIVPHGGITVAEITSPEGINVEAVAQCSAQDNYSKRIGVQIALGRALKELNIIRSS